MLNTVHIFPFLLSKLKTEENAWFSKVKPLKFPVLTEGNYNMLPILYGQRYVDFCPWHMIVKDVQRDLAQTSFSMTMLCT